jgi:hypothetical protein
MSALRDFVADLMERQGAAVEPLEPDGLAIMAAPEDRAALGWHELARLGFGSDLPAGAQRIGIEGDWLERFAALLRDRGRHAACQIAPETLPALGDPERLLGHALDLPNAVWRFKAAQPTWTRCLILTFRTTAVSDEKREGLLRLGFNLGTGAPLGHLLPRLVASLGRDGAWTAPSDDVRRAAGETGTIPAVESRLRPALEAATREELAPFLQATRRRLSRDQARVHAYHDGLRREALQRLAARSEAKGARAAKIDADRSRDLQRIASIEHENRVKLDDLRRNYALRVIVEWVQTLELFVPVQRLEVLIRRRKGERLVRLDWHPLARQVEPMPCDWGPGVVATRLVCDERLHLTEPAGQQPCSTCGKPFCRACHPGACPRCDRVAR